MVFLDEMMKNYLSSPQSQNNSQQQQETYCNKRQLNYNKKMTDSDLRGEYRVAFINEMKYNPFSSQSRNDDFQFLTPLWSMEPRIFAMETSSSGKRKYVVGNLGRFLNHYWRKSDPMNRHYYELIRENTPCRMYFGALSLELILCICDLLITYFLLMIYSDLEYCTIANNHITATESEVLMTEFIDELCSQFLQIYNITLTRSRIVDLDSSTNKKFSRHLIVHLPNNELFANAQSAGFFAKQFVSRLADELTAGTLEERHPTLARNLFVRTKDPDKTTCFVDLGVYTRNRLFRLMGSSKFGKPASAALRIAAANEFQFPVGFGNSKFYVPDLADAPTSSSQVSTKITCYILLHRWIYLTKVFLCVRSHQITMNFANH
jgi:hypothetical protein